MAEEFINTRKCLPCTSGVGGGGYSRREKVEELQFGAFWNLIVALIMELLLIHIYIFE